MRLETNLLVKNSIQLNGFSHIHSIIFDRNNIWIKDFANFDRVKMLNYNWAWDFSLISCNYKTTLIIYFKQ